jgi:MoaA/NifB/PqqE/SkfB family radical SAM enzyme
MIPLRHKIGFLRGLLSGRKAYTAPLSVNIDATHRCNLRCAYCRWHSPLLEKSALHDGARHDLSPELF